jgi:hypothetical protein
MEKNWQSVKGNPQTKPAQLIDPDSNKDKSN